MTSSSDKKPKWVLRHAEFGDKPWAVQAEALRRSHGRKRFAHYLQQGLGKSALAFNEFMISDYQVMLVICPNSFKADWALVPAEWGHPEVDAAYWPEWKGVREGKTLLSMNYDAIRYPKGIEAVNRLFSKYRVMLVLDESSAIKNPQSQTAKIVLRNIAKQADFIRVLNGTPWVQNALDLYAPSRVVGEFEGMNPFAFKNRYCKMGGFMGRQVKGVQNEEELYAKVDNSAFRALTKDWRKDLPDKMPPITVHVEMTGNQRKHYREMMEEFFTQVQGEEVAADIVLTQMDKLRQISSCLIMNEGRVAFLEPPKDNPKLKALMDVFEAGDTKMLVPYTYKASGAMLLTHFEEAGLNPAVIRGGMSPGEITEQKNRFNKDPDCRILVGQENATCRGHTLIGGVGPDSCCRMAFYENSFSLLERLQIEDRILRGAQKEVCHYWDFVASPIEETVIRSLQTKKTWADALDEAIKAVRSEFNVDRKRRV